MLAGGSVYHTRDPGWLFGDEAKTDYSLNPMENYGHLETPGDYSPKHNTIKGNEWRDLWAHHVLEQNGIKAQTHGAADVDLTINGEWREVKSPRQSATQPVTAGVSHSSRGTFAGSFTNSGIGGGSAARGSSSTLGIGTPLATTY